MPTSERRSLAHLTAKMMSETDASESSMAFTLYCHIVLAVLMEPTGLTVKNAIHLTFLGYVTTPGASVVSP